MLKSVHLSGDDKIVIPNPDGDLSPNSFTLLLYLKPDVPLVGTTTLFGWENTVGDL